MKPRRLRIERLEDRCLLAGLDLPVVENFDDGLPTEGWEFSSIREGRQEIVDGRLRQDDYRNGSSYSRNKANLTVDLLDAENVELTFTHWSLKDESTYSDGVHLSAGGVKWHKVWKATPGTHTLDLDVLARNAGMTYNDSFHIGFWQYDNYSAPWDGREWDDIQITGDRVDPTEPIAWPADLGFYKNLFIDGGVSLSARGTYAPRYLGLSYQTMFTSSRTTQNQIIIGSSSDTNGALLYPDGQPRFQAVYTNGGSAAGHSSSLGSTGRSRFAQFYANGGSYTGSCAGMYLIDNYKIANIEFYHNSRSGSHSVTFNENHPFVDTLMKHTGSRTIHNIGHYYGPIIRQSHSNNTPGIEYMGVIHNAPSSIGRLNGTPYIAIYKRGPDTGRMVVQTSHPEYASSGSRLRLQAAQLEYAIAGAKQVPDLKGSLDVGQSVAMVGPTQRVGDKQYHRYEITVGAHQPLNVSLSGLSGNADLYLQVGSGANSKSHIAKSVRSGTSHEQIVMADPCGASACTVQVSVYGNHTTKNGVRYVLATS